ncbi:MAG: hypothetical protein IKD45_03565 [Clostridia bacterium]|nr:hypothetical protein [Clostridia bacterium]
MKLNKIISSALLVILLFTTVIAVVPMKADAAYISSDKASAELTSDQIKEYIYGIYGCDANGVYRTDSERIYDFETAEEMLRYEQELGFLNSVTTPDKEYSIYVNKYTGMLYYVNNVTGQILTSNPYNYTSTTASEKNEVLLSQMVIEFTEISTGSKFTYNSTRWSALYTQISSQFIKGGIRVNYTLGDTTSRFLLPGRILASELEDMLYRPMLEKYAVYLRNYCSNIDYSEADKTVQDIYEFYKDSFSFFDYEEVPQISSKKINKSRMYPVEEYGCLNSRAYKAYFEAMEILYTYNRSKNPNGLNKNSKDAVEREKFNDLNTLKSDFLTLGTAYSLNNPAEFTGKEGYENDDAYVAMMKAYYTPTKLAPNAEIYETHEAIYVFPATADVAKKRTNSLLFQKHVDGYSFNDMYVAEKYCGYVDESANKPVFRCALEYTFNEDGSLSIRLPANSISFDETVYNLMSIMPLEFFGAGNMNEDGYVFYPDGSGTVIAFDDFRNTTVQANQASPAFGKDYCYSNIEGQGAAYLEQISMPVYGVVAGDEANEFTSSKYGFDKVTNGYFAILEEGAALANIGFSTGGTTHAYASAYCKYTPYPSDKYDLSDTISVSGSSGYTIVSDSKYTGSYVTRIVMLADEKIAAINDKYYVASYVGMAKYYRDYLTKNGVLSSFESVSDNLPLYIEALGSMEIIKKILSFPITTKLSLTTFDDISTMYGEISDTEKVKAAFDEKIAEYKKLADDAAKLAADAETEALIAEYTAQKEDYLTLAAEFERLSGEIVKIDNVNFRLTGFGNGGLYNTYPTKVRWDRACGGKKAFNTLVANAKALSEKGENLGIYPDFDFMYINYTALFDGISVRGNVSRMVDNRYASKQEWNSVMHEYESFYTLVINPESLDLLYSKFLKQYAKYDISTVSVSTAGSDLNSNFDEEYPVNRSDAMGYVSDMLDRMANESGYDVMIDVGNIYAVQYAKHIINASIDSSHFRYASYTVPFVGMVLHSSVNYAGAPINYSGDPNYELLRAIESGANLYYILCYQNSTYLKEDETLNSYYGVDYQTWYQDMVLTYTELNLAIGDLQDYTITDHRVILGERVIEEKEMRANYAKLEAEFIEQLVEITETMIDRGYDDMLESNSAYKTKLRVVYDKEAVIAAFVEDAKLDMDELDSEFITEINKIMSDYEKEYAGSDNAANDYVVSIDAIEYDSKYTFTTESLSTDADYDYTDFTSDINNIVLVTYTKGDKTVKFVLNYNIYDVRINLGDGNEFVLPKNGYKRIG